MNNELIRACIIGDVDKIYYLIEKGADIHARNESPLHYASMNGHLEVVKFLVDKGADIHADNDHALRWASENGHLDVVKFLMEKGADVHADDDYALRWASENGHIEVVKFLIDKGSDVSILTIQYKLILSIPITWSVKPDDLPPFRELPECPISGIVFTADVSKLGCSACRNVFKQSSLEEWFKTGKETCPICRKGMVFYAV